MKKIMTFSVACKHKISIKNGIKITTERSYVTMFWYYLKTLKTPWNKRKLWNNGSVLLKITLLLCLNYKCMSLTFEGQDGNRSELEHLPCVVEK